MIEASESRSSDPISGSGVQLAARLTHGVNTNASAIVTIEILPIEVVPVEVVPVKRKRISTSYSFCPESLLLDI
jgi:hypothetical protein